MGQNDIPYGLHSAHTVDYGLLWRVAHKQLWGQTPKVDIISLMWITDVRDGETGPDRAIGGGILVAVKMHFGLLVL
jgi:hypothetical protein